MDGNENGSHSNSSNKLWMNECHLFISIVDSMQVLVHTLLSVYEFCSISTLRLFNKLCRTYRFFSEFTKKKWNEICKVVTFYHHFMWKIRISNHSFREVPYFCLKFIFSTVFSQLTLLYRCKPLKTSYYHVKYAIFALNKLFPLKIRNFHFKYAIFPQSQHKTKTHHRGSQS